MEFSLDQRSASLSVGEFAGFAVGPREASGGPQGLWRAQLGTHWHNELRARAAAEFTSQAGFEISLTGRIFHRGWTLTLAGRIDQVIRTETAVVLREIKSVLRPLPADDAELRHDHPAYFIQLATYAALWRAGLLTSPTGETLAPGEPPSPRAGAGGEFVRGELVFVEADSGLAQTIALSPADNALFQGRLEHVTEFLDARLRSRERLRRLRFRPAFATPRPGQETTQAGLTALFERQPLVLFEAPTGFGKTGVLLEFALGQLRSGHFDRAIYLTSKSTGQLQVVRTLGAMTAAAPEAVAAGTGADADPGTGAVSVWHVRNKAEHCINHTFHCVRDACSYLADASDRWAQSGLTRFYRDEQHARDLDTLRAAGRAARICPYEITRTALAFTDVWIGDYNYVFAPRNRSLFHEQPGFFAPRTLLLVDEAHNLPSRVADACSHTFSAAAANLVRDELHRVRVPAALVTAWSHWCHFLRQLRPANALGLADEDDARHLLGELARHIPGTPLDLAALGPQVAELLWQVPALVEDLTSSTLPRLWWCPREGEFALTCLDASSVIGATLREFGGAVLASATLTPVEGFVAACGLDAMLPPAATVQSSLHGPFRAGPLGPAPAAAGHSSRLGDRAAAASRPTDARAAEAPGQSEAANAAGKIEGSSAPSAEMSARSLLPPARLGGLNRRETRRLFRQLTSAADLLRVAEARDAASPTLFPAEAPWREGAYDVACDARVDTTFQHRSHHYATTAATLAALHAGAHGAVAVFFPSYAYAEAIAAELASLAPALRALVQPRLRDLAAQTAWVDDALRQGDALFLVLGSSFAESIDALGGRVTHAMVVGPALPEVNPVQRARLAEATRRGLTREAAFRRVYQLPGMTKVNQALGRLVRAPGQRARVLLHCRRFLEPGYTSLLAREYRNGSTLHTNEEFQAWLKGTRPD